MDFSGQYLTHSEYRALNGTLAEMPFNILEFEARRLIDTRTQNRLKGSDNIPQEVKLCVFSMINSLQRSIETSEKMKGNVANESIDGYSISYITPDKVGDLVKSNSVELNNTIRTYLLGVIYNDEHLLYVGRNNAKQW